MRALLEALALRLAPKAVWRHRIQHWPISTGEAEEVLLPLLADPRKISIDVGCAEGAYAAHLYLYSRSVAAFEPNPHSFAHLQKLFARTPGLQLIPAALSAAPGRSQLQIPAGRPMLSSLSPPGDRESALVEVELQALDSFQFTPVGFIKIDVEGHEENVLAGAMTTLQRDMPALLMEIEERHNPGALHRIGSLLASLDYTGHFLFEGKLHPLSAFSLDHHQNPQNIPDLHRDRLYINNFLFLPPSHRVHSSWPAP